MKAQHDPKQGMIGCDDRADNKNRMNDDDDDEDNNESYLPEIVRLRVSVDFRISFYFGLPRLPILFLHLIIILNCLNIHYQYFIMLN